MYLRIKVAGSSNSTSTTKRRNPFSKVGDVIDSDSEVDEVLDMPRGTFSSSGGGHDQEGYFEYDDFTDQLHDIPRHLADFYEDFKVQGRIRK